MYPLDDSFENSSDAVKTAALEIADSFLTEGGAIDISYKKLINCLSSALSATAVDIEIPHNNGVIEIDRDKQYIFICGTDTNTEDVITTGERLGIEYGIVRVDK